MTNNIERRRYPRIVVSSVTVEIYSFLGDAVPAETCAIVDISENGLRFATKNFYSDAQVLRLTFFLPHEKVPIQTNAVVVHKRFHDELFHIGTQFRNISETDLTHLQSFLKKYLPASRNKPS